MQNADFRLQNASARLAITLTCALASLLRSNVAVADGGTLRLSQRFGPWRVSVFTSPAVPNVGPIDISTLVQDAATGRVCDDVPMIVRLKSIERPGLTLEQEATVSAATNKLFRAALIDVPETGKWRAEILVGVESLPASDSDRNFPTPTFDFDVAAPPTEWLSLAAWVAWPIVLIAGFLMHQILVTRSACEHSFRLQRSNRQNCVDTI